MFCQSPTRNLSIIIACFPNQIYNQKLLEIILISGKTKVKYILVGEVQLCKKKFLVLIWELLQLVGQL